MTNHSPGSPVRGNVLIVDDTPANLQVLAGMLKEQGFRVRALPNGRLALQGAAAEPPDLILLDIMMPEMDGYEVCRRLKESEALRDIPVIFISALNETLDKVKAFGCGGVDYVGKPFQLEEVMARVTTHIQIRHLQLAVGARNRELEETLHKLTALEQLRDSLVHMMVHDMRTPLAAIIGYLDLLRESVEQNCGKQELSFLNTVSWSAKGLIEMVSSMLDLNRLECGEMPLQRQSFDLVKIANDALGSLGALAKEYAISLDAPGDGLVALADPIVTQRVLVNLLGNAFKFTPRGRSVRIEMKSEPGSTYTAVIDAGPGIPESYHGKIFEKFGQVESRKEHHKYSTGLGLAFCKMAVEAQGGTIGVSSEVGKGSTFWFRLPIPGDKPQTPGEPEQQ